jgi:hypothetical protein
MILFRMEKNMLKNAPFGESTILKLHNGREMFV